MAKSELLPATDRPLRVGEGRCPCCGRMRPISKSRSGYLYIKCGPLYDGGCQLDLQARSDKSSRWIASMVESWDRPEYRAALLEDREDRSASAEVDDGGSDERVTAEVSSTEDDERPLPSRRNLWELGR